MIAFALCWSGGYATGVAASQRPIALALDCALRRGHLVVGGRVDADGLVADGEVEGRVSLGKHCRYRLRFRDADGAACRLVGTQRLSLSGLPSAITVLHAEIWRDQAWLGEATLRFDPRSDLAPLLASFSLRSKRGSSS